MDADDGLPPELAAAFESDPGSSELFDRLRRRERDELFEHVRSAKRPETRVRRAGKVIESVRRRDELRRERVAAGEVRPPTTELIDAAISDVIAPSLKERGFRKQRHHWQHASADVVRRVTVQSSQFNETARGRFTVTVGASYPQLGETVPDGRWADECRHHLRLGMVIDGADRWWSFEDARDPTERQRVTDALRADWIGHGLPFVDACAEPTAFRDAYLRRGAFPRAADLSIALGDMGGRDRAVELWLQELRSRPMVLDGKGDLNEVARAGREYLDVARYLAGIGGRLSGPDRHAGLEILAVVVGWDVEATALERRIVDVTQAEELIELGGLLDLDVREPVERVWSRSIHNRAPSR